MDSADQKKFFDEKRAEGMGKHNYDIWGSKTFCKSDEAKLMRQRRPKHQDEPKFCLGCEKVFSNRTFSKHVQKCKNPSRAAPVRPIDKHLSVNKIHKDQGFIDDIMSKFTENEAGNLCRTDKLIQQLGYKQYSKRRYESSKIDEVRKNVMCNMRELARIFIVFRDIPAEEGSKVTVEDMFTRDHLDRLCEAINRMAAKDDPTKEKHGLKLTHNAIILRTIKTLQCLYNDTKQDDKYDELKRFRNAYLNRKEEMFGKALYTVNAASMNKSRRPENQLEQEQLRKLNSKIAEELKRLSGPPISDFEIRNYSWLRSLVVCRITLYNARRGEEPARMMLSEWQDALNDVWLPPKEVKKIVDEGEQYLIGKYKLVYLSGKGRKFVPVLVPLDIVKPIKILTEYRQAHGIKEDNHFAFATKTGNRHASGWHAVSDVCKKAEVKVNATANRHYVSTYYASLDMSLNDQKVFLDHMGHEAHINKDNYQCPIGIKEVRVMGRMLEEIDGK